MEIRQFKKKPVVIEAVQYLADDAWAVANWCGGTVVFLVPDGSPACPWFLNIPTLEGTMRAADGDWIIKGIAGEFYPCAAEIFALTYEAV